LPKHPKPRIFKNNDLTTCTLQNKENRLRKSEKKTKTG